MVTVKLGNWSLGFGSNVDGDRKRPLVLLILDGWGHNERRSGNAIALANTPNFDQITSKYPGTVLAAAGQRVGLTQESPGNPEIGHLNIGTGRAIKSNKVRITEALADGSFLKNPVLNTAFKKVRKRNTAIHFVGLLSSNTIHSSTEALFSLLRMAKKYGLTDNVFVHGILDGVDMPPRSADIYVEAMQIKLADIGIGKIATLCGRQYAMDNSENWQRTAKAYTMLAHAEGLESDDPVDAVRDSFLRGLNDEFVPPIIICRSDKKPVASIRKGDVVIFFNHRGDEIKQLVRAVSESEVDKSAAFTKPKVDVVCMTEYDSDLNEPVAFPAEEEENVLADVLENHNIAAGKFGQTDRLEHLTYFFNGMDQVKHSLEHRVLVPSSEVNATERPEMGSFKIADNVLRAIEKGEEDVFIVNFSAADIAARSGNLEKTIEAVQFVDTCLGGIIDKVREHGGVALVTSDHGNCEDMSLNGSAPTPFTANPVPFYLVGDHLNGLKLRVDGALEDIAPTILGILGIEKPNEMTGNDLRLL